jgi:hypothetical protein
MDKVIEIPEREYMSLRAIVKAAEELCEALCSSEDCAAIGSDIEVQCFNLVCCLSDLPEHFEAGRYKWEEIEADWRHDAPGG